MFIQSAVQVQKTNNEGSADLVLNSRELAGNT